MCSPAPLLKEEDGREKEDGSSSLSPPFLPLPPRNIRRKEKGKKDKCFNLLFLLLFSILQGDLMLSEIYSRIVFFLPRTPSAPFPHRI